jgi:hypothetical protein
MTTEKLCGHNGCANPASIAWDEEYHYDYCTSCRILLQSRDRENLRRWARLDRQDLLFNRVRRWGISLVVAGLALWGLVALVKFFWMFS